MILKVEPTDRALPYAQHRPQVSRGMTPLPSLNTGEAMVVAQSMALLAWDATHLVLLNTAAAGAPQLGSLAGGSAAQERGRSEGGAFVELLTAACLLAGPPLVLLLRRASRPSQPNWPMLGASACSRLWPRAV